MYIQYIHILIHRLLFLIYAATIIGLFFSIYFFSISFLRHHVLYCASVSASSQALPRRRVSVAVVPKFNLLNIPGQSPTTVVPGPGQAPSAGPSAGAALPVLVGFPVPSGGK